MSEPTHEPSPAPATSDEELLGRIADDFAARRRRGERPTADEYIAKHPPLAERIRKVLSAVGMIEQTVPFDLTPGDQPGSTIGRYRLLERIGEGGFGVVYMAEQITPVRRKVALKVLKPGMDSRQVLARFDAERQALAIMDHPNIARVFDAGATDAGRPYFVMELVKGVPITEFCDQHQLTPRQRLELFAHVCHAVQHAHQKGIIHRDIKPSNVLVMMQDTEPVVKVIDFGIAKALGQELTEKTLFTGFAQLLGTPLYMSPEQAGQSALDVDTRSDIYSLGVLLYELLTGTTPFDKERFRRAAHDEIRRIIREEDPPKPSTRLSTSKELHASISAHRQTGPAKLTRLVRGELDWIVMKALEKDRSRRYETADGLAMDVQCYLRDEPVLARSPSPSYFLRKFVRRNKRAVLSASLILLALIAGAIGTTWGLIRAEKQRLVVEGQRNELAERNQALHAAHEHKHLLNERARQAIETVTSATAIEQLTRQKELRPEQKDFLDKMIRYYVESAEDGVATEQERSRQAQAYHRMGRMNQILGRPQDSENAYRRAVALFRQLAADFPTQPELRQDLALSHNALGTLRSANRPTEAESAYVEAMAILKQLAADFPTRPEFRQELAGVQNNLGNLLFRTGRPAEAETAHAGALAIRKQLAADLPSRRILHRALAMSHNNLGWLYQSTGRLEKAEAAYREAVPFQKRAVVDFPERPELRLELASYLFNYSNVLRDSARATDAKAAHAEGLAVYEQLVADFPNRPEFRQGWADAELQGHRSTTGAGRLEERGTGAGDEGEGKVHSGTLAPYESPKK